MTIAPLDLILLLGSLQGFILTVLLWQQPKGNRLSNRLLAVLIGSLALMSLAVGVPVNGWVSLALDFLPFFMAMPIGPLIYFYTKSLLDPTFRLGKTERQHFYTVVLDWGAPLAGWIFLIGTVLGVFLYEDGPKWGHFMNQYNTYADIPRWLSATVYLLLTRQWLHNYQPARQSAVSQQNGRWLRQFVNVFLVFQIIWFIHLVPYVIPSLRDPLLSRFGWYPIYIPMAILIYWLGLKGYLHARTESLPEPVEKPLSADLPEEVVTATLQALTSAMSDDRLFLDPELTVEKLGRHTRLAPKLISAVLNQHLGKNFNGFVNAYRIEEVKHRLTNPAYEHLTLTGIAYDCGFNSQATFQRVFKQATGVSPRAYVARQIDGRTPIGA